MNIDTESDKTGLLQKLANATKTYYNVGGHHKSRMNKEKKAEYEAALRDAGHEIPSDDELCKIGIFNGKGAY
jgi:hypothetical protein